ncbi:hypothetical protein L2E82_23126 [Cichorium intybus]|uniref:Uncharacterized protein n=1 Tax=Cichorium intybus TaxID=13427 RepID=A0ACB9DZV8_CICIN|nr:hypothetical protein L2E82_23126 [Cichorium intybus]
MRERLRNRGRENKIVVTRGNRRIGDVLVFVSIPSKNQRDDRKSRDKDDKRKTRGYQSFHSLPSAPLCPKISFFISQPCSDHNL